MGEAQLMTVLSNLETGPAGGSDAVSSMPLYGACGRGMLDAIPGPTGMLGF